MNERGKKERGKKERKKVKINKIIMSLVYKKNPKVICVFYG
jgi:hypothetical protein